MMKQRLAWQWVLCLMSGLFCTGLVGTNQLGLPQLSAQDKTSESVVLKAKEISGKTGRPILAIAGSNT